MSNDSKQPSCEIEANGWIFTYFMFIVDAGVPVKLLFQGEGHVVTVELKNGEVYRGQLVAAEDTMNCQLKEGRWHFIACDVLVNQNLNTHCSCSCVYRKRWASESIRKCLLARRTHQIYRFTRNAQEFSSFEESPSS